MEEKLKKGSSILKEGKGITLIALVITIIILLILAGVTVSLVLNGGIITQAQNATKATQDAQEKEKQALIDAEIAMLGYSGKDKEGIIEAMGGTDGKFTKDGITYGLTSNLKLITYTNEGVPIPQGFEKLEGTKDTGLVIKDSTGNEYVWVPIVDKTNYPMHWTNGTEEVGQLYTFTKQTGPTYTNPTKITGFGTGYREPGTLSNASYDQNAGYLAKAGMPAGKQTEADFKTQLKEEFKDMIDSVDTYGGFYIGRYETGWDSDGKKPVIKKGATLMTADITDDPLYATPKAQLTWYGMYRESKRLEGESVVSSMIWGSQWDQTLIWMTKTSDDPSYPFNAEGKGAWGGSVVKPAGQHKVNNIYDMAGNAYDWTLEANNTDFRVLRGGYYSRTATNQYAGNRNNNAPNDTSAYYGTRAQLYIK